jgi:hypothetical protein
MWTFREQRRGRVFGPEDEEWRIKKFIWKGV